MTTSTNNIARERRIIRWIVGTVVNTIVLTTVLLLSAAFGLTTGYDGTPGMDVSRLRIDFGASLLSFVIGLVVLIVLAAAVIGVIYLHRKHYHKTVYAIVAVVAAILATSFILGWWLNFDWASLLGLWPLVLALIVGALLSVIQFYVLPKRR